MGYELLRMNDEQMNRTEREVLVFQSFGPLVGVGARDSKPEGGAP